MSASLFNKRREKDCRLAPPVDTDVPPDGAAKGAPAWLAQTLAEFGIASPSVEQLVGRYPRPPFRAIPVDAGEGALGIEYEDDGLVCADCGGPGEFLECSRCSAVVHLACAGLDEIPAAEWFCRSCVSVDPTRKLAMESEVRDRNVLPGMFVGTAELKSFLLASRTDANQSASDARSRRRNHAKEMEDRHLVRKGGTLADGSSFAVAVVADGHSGPEAADTMVPQVFKRVSAYVKAFMDGDVPFCDLDDDPGSDDEAEVDARPGDGTGENDGKETSERRRRRLVSTSDTVRAADTGVAPTAASGTVTSVATAVAAAAHRRAVDAALDEELAHCEADNDDDNNGNDDGDDGDDDGDGDGDDDRSSSPPAATGREAAGEAGGSFNFVRAMVESVHRTEEANEAADNGPMLAGYVASESDAAPPSTATPGRSVPIDEGDTVVASLPGAPLSPSAPSSASPGKLEAPPIVDLGEPRAQATFRRAVEQIYAEVDKEYLVRKQSEFEAWMARGGDPSAIPEDSGCTMLVAVHVRGWIVLCNLGDSRALLMKDKGRNRPGIVAATEDHETCLARIVDVIAKRGALFYHNHKQKHIDAPEPGGMPRRRYKRLKDTYIDPAAYADNEFEIPCRRLGLSGALGNLVFKLDQDHVMLQTVPDVSFHRLDEGAIYYVVMASDGLWDYTSMDKVDHQNTLIATVLHRTLAETGSLAAVAANLCERTFARHFKVYHDDCTVVVFSVQDPGFV